MFRQAVPSNFELLIEFFQRTNYSTNPYRRKTVKVFSTQCFEISKTVIRQFLAADYENQLKKFESVAPL